MFYVYNCTDGKLEAAWRTVNEAVDSCQYLTKTHAKQYWVLARVYDSETYHNQRHEARMQAEFDKYGTD